MDRVERRQQVGRHDLLELRGRLVLEACGAAVHAGVVDQPVDPAEALRGVADPALDRLGAGHVEHGELGAPAGRLDLADGLLAAFRAARGDRHGRPLGREPCRDAAPDPARATGDECDAARSGHGASLGAQRSARGLAEPTVRSAAPLVEVAQQLVRGGRGPRGGATPRRGRARRRGPSGGRAGSRRRRTRSVPWSRPARPPSGRGTSPRTRPRSATPGSGSPSSALGWTEPHSLRSTYWRASMSLRQCSTPAGLTVYFAMPALSRVRA